ncbi:MAG: rhodanese-related sulfurtransferase [Xanthomonadales bacterium]|nr:rhodanese-related sulfurtransferase [Xanthomonadales bacterium]
MSETNHKPRNLVAAFYKFVSLPDHKDLRGPILQRCEDLGLVGTILLAEKGINGTVAGQESGVRRFQARLTDDRRLAGLSWKESWCEHPPFYRMKVRLKKEIVSLGVDGIDPAHRTGEYVSPQAWNDLIRRDDVRVIDTRNEYEVHLGRFEGAEDPRTRAFRDFPKWADEHLDPGRDRHVAMYCTGGIRCEKATAYLLERGFEHVYHLDGGILNYLEQIDRDASAWQGECFVFDNRVTVDHDLAEGDFEVCPACRMPLTEDDRASPQFELHVSCPKCFDRLTEEKRQGLLERARQMALAAERGEKHLGMRQAPPPGSRFDSGE